MSPYKQNLKQTMQRCRQGVWYPAIGPCGSAPEECSDDPSTWERKSVVTSPRAMPKVVQNELAADFLDEWDENVQVDADCIGHYMPIIWH